MRIIITNHEDYYTLSLADLNFMANFICDFIGTDVVAMIYFCPGKSPVVTFMETI